MAGTCDSWFPYLTTGRSFSAFSPSPNADISSARAFTHMQCARAQTDSYMCTRRFADTYIHYADRSTPTAHSVLLGRPSSAQHSRAHRHHFLKEPKERLQHKPAASFLQRAFSLQSEQGVQGAVYSHQPGCLAIRRVLGGDQGASWLWRSAAALRLAPCNAPGCALCIYAFLLCKV